MSKTFLLTIIVTLTITTSAFSQDLSEKDRTAVRAVIQEWNDAAWASDLERFMALYDKSPDIWLIGSDVGEINHGEQQIRAWLTPMFNAANFSWNIRKLDITGNGKTAWAFMVGDMRVRNRKSGKEFTKAYRFSAILVKRGKTWKWSMFNGSEPVSGPDKDKP